jgi:hypothetical protein
MGPWDLHRWDETSTPRLVETRRGAGGEAGQGLEAVAFVGLLGQAVHRLPVGDALALAGGSDAAPADGDGRGASAGDLPELAGAVALVGPATKGDVSLEGVALVGAPADIATGAAVGVGADGAGG